MNESFFPNEIVFDIFLKAITQNEEAKGFLNMALISQQFAHVSRDFSLQQLQMDTYIKKKRETNCVWLRNFPTVENMRKREKLKRLYSKYENILNTFEEDEFGLKDELLSKLHGQIATLKTKLSRKYLPFQAKILNADEGYYVATFGIAYVLQEIERGKIVVIGKLDSFTRFSSLDDDEKRRLTRSSTLQLELKSLTEEEEEQLIPKIGCYKQKKRNLCVHPLKTSNYYYAPEEKFVIHVTHDKQAVVFGTFKRGKFSPRLTTYELKVAIQNGLTYSMYPHKQDVINDLKVYCTNKDNS